MTARYNRARTILQAPLRRASMSDRCYTPYVLTLTAGVYLPGLWILLSTGMHEGPYAIGENASFIHLVLFAAVLAVSTSFGPIRISTAEFTFLLSGQFSPMEVLWTRTAVLLGLFSCAGIFVDFAMRSDGPSDSIVSAMLASLSTAIAGVALGAGAAWVPLRWVRAASVVGILGWLGASALSGRDELIDILCDMAVMSIFLFILPKIARTAELGAIAARQDRLMMASVSMLIGDQDSGLQLFRARSFRNRHCGLSGRILRKAPIVAADLHGLVRRPWLSVAAVAVALSSAYLLTQSIFGAFPVAAAACSVCIYACTGAWTQGLRAYCVSAEFPSLLAGGPLCQFAFHLVVPSFMAAAVSFVVVPACIFTSDNRAAPLLIIALSALLAISSVRFWTCSASRIPNYCKVPIITPAGDLSVIAKFLWYVRGYIISGIIGLALAVDPQFPERLEYFCLAAIALMLVFCYFAVFNVARSARGE